MKDIQFSKPEIWERVWGEEILLVHTDEYTVKFLKMKKGTRGGLQFHKIKNEAQYLMSGKVQIEYDAGDGLIKKVIWEPGQSVYTPPGLVHRETALEDSVIIEGSNPVFNDRVRCEEWYGERVEGGLPTTSLDEVEIGLPRRKLTEEEKESARKMLSQHKG